MNNLIAILIIVISNLCTALVMKKIYFEELKPVGGFLISKDYDEDVVRIGIALFHGIQIKDILDRKYVTLKVDCNIPFFDFYDESNNSKENHSLYRKESNNETRND